MSGWQERFRGLFSSDDILEADRLKHESAQAGATPLAQVRPHELTTLHGRVVAITLMPVHGVRQLEADVSDGTGVVRLIWVGRHEVPGIVPGAEMTMTGRTCEVDGRLVMYNPRYELTSAEQ
jgi:RecG-like helicase